MHGLYMAIWNIKHKKHQKQKNKHNNEAYLYIGTGYNNLAKNTSSQKLSIIICQSYEKRLLLECTDIHIPHSH